MYMSVDYGPRCRDHSCLFLNYENPYLLRYVKVRKLVHHHDGELVVHVNAWKHRLEPLKDCPGYVPDQGNTSCVWLELSV